MARDIKLNYYQYTPKQLKQKMFWWMVAFKDQTSPSKVGEIQTNSVPNKLPKKKLLSKTTANTTTTTTTTTSTTTTTATKQ